jgi:hypothetical protein
MDAGRMAQDPQREDSTEIQCRDDAVSLVRHPSSRRFRKKGRCCFDETVSTPKPWCNSKWVFATRSIHVCKSVERGQISCLGRGTEFVELKWRLGEAGLCSVLEVTRKAILVRNLIRSRVRKRAAMSMKCRADVGLRESAFTQLNRCALLFTRQFDPQIHQT